MRRDAGALRLCSVVKSSRSRRSRRSIMGHAMRKSIHSGGRTELKSGGSRVKKSRMWTPPHSVWKRIFDVVKARREST